MKKKVAIIFGGRSTEHNISRISAHSIIKNIDSKLFDVIIVGITKKGEWLHYTGDVNAIPDGSWEKYANPTGNICLEKGINALKQCDIIIPVLHGQNGEDGTVQGLFELLDIPYVGCGVLSSSVCMDKAYTKIILKAAGIPQCRHLVVYRHILEENPAYYMDIIPSKIGFPCFIKPSNSGSSIGVHKAKSPTELFDALMEAKKYDRKIIVEEFVDGREIECAILGNTTPEAATLGEIAPSKEFYDYEDKYIKDSSIAYIPANICPSKSKEIKEIALKAFSALDCAGLARIDFFLKKNGEILLNEVNTFPGFTNISMYSKMWMSTGLSYTDLLTRLIDLAFLHKKECSRYTG